MVVPQHGLTLGSNPNPNPRLRPYTEADLWFLVPWARFPDCAPSEWQTVGRQFPVNSPPLFGAPLLVPCPGQLPQSPTPWYTTDHILYLHICYLYKTTLRSKSERTTSQGYQVATSAIKTYIRLPWVCMSIRLHISLDSSFYLHYFSASFPQYVLSFTLQRW